MAHSSEIEKLERRWMDNPTGLTFAPLAEAYRRAGDHARALEVLELGLAQHAGYVPALIVQARCHLDARLSGEAESSFHAVLNSDPHNLIALKGLADICELTERLPAAQGFLDRLLNADPTHPEAGLQRDRILDLLGRREAMTGTAMVESTSRSEVPETAAPGDLELILEREPSLEDANPVAGEFDDPALATPIVDRDQQPGLEVETIEAELIERSEEFGASNLSGGSTGSTAVDRPGAADSELTIERIENPFEGFDATTWDLPFGEVEVPSRPFEEHLSLDADPAPESDRAQHDDAPAVDSELVVAAGYEGTDEGTESPAPEAVAAEVVSQESGPAESEPGNSPDEVPVEWTPVASTDGVSAEIESEAVEEEAVAAEVGSEAAGEGPEAAAPAPMAEFDAASGHEAVAGHEAEATAPEVEVETSAEVEPAASVEEPPVAEGVDLPPVAESPAAGAEGSAEVAETDAPEPVAAAAVESVDEGMVPVSEPARAEPAPEPLDLRLEGVVYEEVAAGWRSSTDWSDVPAGAGDETLVDRVVDATASVPGSPDPADAPAAVPEAAVAVEEIDSPAGVEAGAVAAAEGPEPEDAVESAPAGAEPAVAVGGPAAEPEEAVTVVEGAFEEEPEEAAPEPAPEVEPELVITETMAEIFLRQGHRPLALAVYAQLLEREPGNQRLADAVTRLRDELLVARSPEPPSQRQGEPGGREEPIGSFLARVLGPEATEEAAFPPAPAEPEPVYTGPLSGRPTRPAEDPLFSLNTIFGEDSRHQASVRPGPGSGGDEAEPSFDEFFGEAGVPAGAGGDEAELEQFNAWLRSLQR